MKKKQTTVEKFKAIFSGGVVISAKEAIEVAGIIAAATALKFVNATAGDKTYNIEGDDVTVGAVIYEILEGDENGEVPDGEIEITIAGFEPFTITVADGLVSVVGEMVAVEDVDLSTDIDIDAKVEAAVKKALSLSSVDKTKTIEFQFAELEATMLKVIQVELKKIPAMASVEFKQAFEKDNKKEVEDPNASAISTYTGRRKRN